MTVERLLLALIAAALVHGVVLAAPAPTGDDACVKCHAALFQKKSVHGAVPMGCSTCHVAMDAEAPHKVRGKVAKGLPMEPSAQCLNCHESKLFAGKVVHAPVAAGLCLVCHDPHASEHAGLLKKAPATLCLDCHPDVGKTPHVIAGFSRAGHPLGEDGKGKMTDDPSRPGKKFYCASCHEPHSAALPALMRFRNGMSSCQKCHKI